MTPGGEGEKGELGEVAWEAGGSWGAVFFQGGFPIFLVNVFRSRGEPRRLLESPETPVLPWRRHLGVLFSLVFLCGWLGI